MKDLLKILLTELILFFICLYFQPDLIISDDGKILNSTERVNAFKTAFLYTLPIQLFLIFILIRKIKITKNDKSFLTRESIKSISWSLSGTLLIILIYLSNSI